MNPTTLPKPADRTDWLEQRHGYWNASSTATLFHEHPFQNLHTEVTAKLAPVVNGHENQAMKRGRHLEAAVSDWWAEDTGLELYEPDVVYTYGPIMATLDRRIVGNDTDAVEIKTTTKEVDRPERYWWWQVQTQMLCADLERVHIVAMDGTMQLKTWIVERDDTAVDQIVDAATPIMDSIRDGVMPNWIKPPPPAKHTDHVIELDDDGQLLVHDLAALRADIKALGETESQLKNLIGEVLGNAQAGTVNGDQIVVYRSSTRRTIDARALRAEHPDIADEYTKSKTFRSLRVVS
jgi:predicted phage-related endonuclease